MFGVAVKIAFVVLPAPVRVLEADPNSPANPISCQCYPGRQQGSSNWREFQGGLRGICQKIEDFSPFFPYSFPFLAV